MASVIHHLDSGVTQDLNIRPVTFMSKLSSMRSHMRFESGTSDIGKRAGLEKLTFVGQPPASKFCTPHFILEINDIYVIQCRPQLTVIYQTKKLHS